MHMFTHIPPAAHAHTAETAAAAAADHAAAAAAAALCVAFAFLQDEFWVFAVFSDGGDVGF